MDNGEYSELLDFFAYMNDPETPHSWNSPTNAARDRLAAIPEEQYETSAADQRYADIGCGDGSLTVDLAETYGNADVYGIDLAAKHALVASENAAADNITIRGGHMHDILADQDPFDVIYAVNTLQMVDDIDETLDDLQRSLADNGLLVATVPNMETQNVFAPAFQEYDTDRDLPYIQFEDAELGEHMVTVRNYMFPRCKMRTLLEDHGLDVVNRYPRTIPADGDGLDDLLAQFGDDTAENIGETVDIYIAEKQ